MCRLGPGRWRLVRQLLAESLLLGFAGGALGVLVARWSCDVLLALFARGRTVPAMALALIDRVLLFATATSVLTALGFGLLPGAAGFPGGACRDPERLWPRRGWRDEATLARMLVVAQLALTVLLLSVAALFARTLQQLTRVAVGYNQEGVVVARIDPRAAGYGAERLDTLHRRIVERLEVTPGVRSASLSLHGPLSGGARVSSLAVEGFEPPRDTPLEVQEDVVTANYFQTVGLRLVRGRLFGPADHSRAHAAIINETMARRFFAAGTRLAATGTPAVRLGQTTSRSCRRRRPCSLQRPAKRHAKRRLSTGLAVRWIPHKRGGAPAVPPTARRMRCGSRSRRSTRGFPSWRSQRSTHACARSRRRSVRVALLAAVFGLAALLLACLGLYGILAYNVTRRTPELGVRIALGARRGAGPWLVMRDALVIVALGLGIGLPLALLAAQQMSLSFPYQVAPADLLSYTAAGLVLVDDRDACCLDTRAHGGISRADHHAAQRVVSALEAVGGTWARTARAPAGHSVGASCVDHRRGAWRFGLTL